MLIPAALPISAAIPKLAIADKKASNIPDMSEGTTKGSVILKKTFDELAPEIRAASSREGSIFSSAESKLIKM